MNIGEKIYYLRDRIKLSQDELADRLGVSRQTVSNWETYRAKPDTEKVVALCGIFNVCADYLLIDALTDPLPAVVVDKTPVSADEAWVGGGKSETTGRRLTPKLFAIALAVLGGAAAILLTLSLVWLLIGDPGRGTSTLEFTFSPAAVIFVLGLICLAALGLIIYFYYRKKQSQ